MEDCAEEEERRGNNEGMRENAWKTERNKRKGEGRMRGRRRMRGKLSRYRGKEREE